jgi:hypothetical protein
VDFGPCVVHEQWLCGSEPMSVLGSRVVAVWLFVVIHAWYKGSGYVLLNLGPCVGIDQWLYICGF